MRAVLAIAILGCSLFSGAAFAGAKEDCASQAIDNADRIKACSAIISNPSSTKTDLVAAYIGRGAAKLIEEDTNGAINDHTKAIELAPKAAWLYAERARTYVLANKYPEAEEDFDQAVDLEPKNPVRYTSRRDFLKRKRQNYHAALEDATKVIDLTGEEEDWFARGDIYTLMGKSEKAIADISKSIALGEENHRKRPDVGRGLINAFEYGYRGLNYLNLKKYDLAITDFSKALANFKVKVLWRVRGIAFAAKGQYELAVEDFTRSIEAKPDEASGYYLRADAYERSGQPELAAADRTEAALIETSLKDPALALTK